MYGNPYYNTQVSLDKIDNQIRELENMRNHLQRPQQPSINQTFQLVPNNQNGLKFVSGIEDVSKELVFGDSVFFDKDFKNMWFKDVKGNIKTYELNEVIKKDEKDLMIEDLRAQIEKLKKERVDDEKSSDTDVDKSSTGSVEK